MQYSMKQNSIHVAQKITSNFQKMHRMRHYNVTMTIGHNEPHFGHEGVEGSDSNQEFLIVHDICGVGPVHSDGDMKFVFRRASWTHSSLLHFGFTFYHIADLVAVIGRIWSVILKCVG